MIYFSRIIKVVFSWIKLGLKGEKIHCNMRG